MDLRQLGYVVAVVDHGGFTRAAEAVHVAQPSLSQAVRALEAELGVELFHRTSRTVRLTAAGEALLEPARQAIRDVATVRAAVAEVAGLEAGHLDLVSLPSLAVHPTAALIGRFRVAHPGIAVRLVEPEDVEDVVVRVRTGTSEIGLTELPVVGSGLVSRPLGSQEYVALIPTALAERLSGTTRITPATLARQPIITTPPGTSARRLLDESIAAAGLRMTVAVETDHREVIAPLVAAGAGVAIVPREVAEGFGAPDVECRTITPRIIRHIGIVHRDGPLSPAAHRFLEMALDTQPAQRRPAPRRRR